MGGVMARLTNAEVAAIAARFGHRDVSVQQTPRGLWIYTCSCGVKSTQRIKQSDAAGAAAHHLRLVARAFVDSGGSARGAHGASEGKGANAPAAASSAA